MGAMPKAQSRAGTLAATPVHMHQANQGSPSKHPEYGQDGYGLVATDEVRYSAQGSPYPHNLLQATHTFPGAPAREGTAASDRVTFHELSSGNNVPGAFLVQSAGYSSKKPPINQNMKAASTAYRGPGFMQPASSSQGQPVGQQHPSLAASAPGMRSS